MFKTSLLLLLLCGVYSCTKSAKNRVVTDDYALIEFAALLEQEKQPTLRKTTEKNATH